MIKKNKKDNAKDGVKIRGFFRLQIVEDGPDGKPIVMGDTGWRKNTVVDTHIIYPAWKFIIMIITSAASSVRSYTQ